MCDSILHSTGPVVIPTCFLAKYSPQISPEQEEVMVLAIVAMGTAVDSIQEDMPFMGASVAEEALQQASGTRIPINSAWDVMDYPSTRRMLSTYGGIAQIKPTNQYGTTSRKI